MNQFKNFEDPQCLNDFNNYVTVVDAKVGDHVTYYLPFKNEQNLEYLQAHIEFLDLEKIRYVTEQRKQKEIGASYRNMVKQRTIDNSIIFTRLRDLKLLHEFICKQNSRNVC